MISLDTQLFKAGGQGGFGNFDFSSSFSDIFEDVFGDFGDFGLEVEDLEEAEQTIEVVI